MGMSTFHHDEYVGREPLPATVFATQFHAEFPGLHPGYLLIARWDGTSTAVLLKLLVAFRLKD
jgi:hypothetical protein